jgi:hypothetical protein
MRRGYYSIATTVQANVAIKYEGKFIQSWRHKQVRDAGKEVWYFSGNGRWNRSPIPGVTKKAEVPKIVQMMELTGAL